MIRFACPTCQSVLDSPDDSAGDKLACPRCGQRLQVPTPPAPPPNKTVLGALLPGEGGPASAAGVAVTCPGCGRTIPLRPEEMALAVECARCGTRFGPAGPQGTPPDPVRDALPGTGPRRGPRRKRRAESVIPKRARPWFLIVVVLALILPLIGLVPLLVFWSSALAPPNARCPSCGYEFRIVEVRNLSAAFRPERCPRCGRRGTAGHLINEFDEYRGR
jgi:DNA-directed RNA polymerase subunit RPC12/RpoP